MKNTNQLLSLLGHSLESPPLKSEMNYLDLPIELESKSDNFGNVTIFSRDQNNEIELVFQTYDRYLIKYGKPEFIKEESLKEPILNIIHYNIDYKNNKILTNINMPFELALGDYKDDVCSKITVKPKDKQKTPWGHAWYFFDTKFYSIVRFNDKFELLGISIHKYDLAELKKIEITKNIDAQKNNIKPENSARILAYHDKLPTLEWSKRKASGDDMFNEENIKLTENILNSYITTINNCTLKKKNKVIYNSIKKVVKELNKINKNNGHFIETIEREELCDFINSIIRETGFKFDDSIDLTEEWRSW